MHLNLKVSAASPDALEHVADLLRDMAKKRRKDLAAGLGAEPWGIRLWIAGDDQLREETDGAGAFERVYSPFPTRVR